MASWHPTMIFLFLSFPSVNAAVRWRNSQWSITHHLVADKHILLPMKSRTFVSFNWCGRLIVACFSKIVQQVKGASAREIPSCKQLLLAGGDFLRAHVFCQRSLPLRKISDKLLVIVIIFVFLKGSQVSEIPPHKSSHLLGGDFPSSCMFRSFALSSLRGTRGS